MRVNGIQQVGVGTCDFRKSWDWFIRNFGFDVKILEDDTVAQRMLPYTGGKPRKRHACIAVNLNGGGGLEIWQYSEREPLAPAFRPMIGDLGIFAAKVRCRDIQAAAAGLETGGTTTGQTPDGKPCLYTEDLYGNIFQLVADDYVFVKQKTPVGGVCGAMVGVSDIDRAVEFYCGIIGYDTIVYDHTGTFEDWKDLPGGTGRYRRVLLSNSKAVTSPFGGLFGPNTLELVQALDRVPRKIYEGRYWGDPGFIQICYDVTGMDEFGRHCAAKGHPFTVDSCPSEGEIFDMGEASGRFTYIEDPDGTLLEFVETYKVPVAGKLGWFIDLRKRNPLKPLPKFLFRAMGLISRQKIQQ